jgi:RNA polymerase sigma-70 factor (ECF subfamily)
LRQASKPFFVALPQGDGQNAAAYRGAQSGGAMQSGESSSDRLEQLFFQYNSDLRRFFSTRLPNASDVDDCAQEAFLNLWKQEKEGRLREDVRGYLFTIAWNVLRDFWRRTKARRQNLQIPLSQFEASERSTGAEVDALLRSREIVRLIERQLPQMRPSTRTVFLLLHVEELQVPEIARRLGISRRTVEREAARAIDHLKHTLGGTLQDLLR